jgi:TRAP-type C4-dicarboxylate transport system permease small subunit
MERIMQTEATELSGEYVPDKQESHPSDQYTLPEPPLGWLRNLVVVISGTGLLALMFVMAGDVIGRYLFNRPVPGAYELVEYLMGIIVPFSVAYSAAQKCHVGVDILVEKLPRKQRAVVDIFTQIITVVLVSYVIWQGWVGYVEAQGSGIKSAVLQLPNAPFLLAIPIGFVAFVMFMCVHIFQDIREACKK